MKVNQPWEQIRSQVSELITEIEVLTSALKKHNKENRLNKRIKRTQLKMVEAKPFSPVKLICGAISSQGEVFRMAEERLVNLYGPIDLASPLVKFSFTDYYEEQMGKNLKREFLSFARLISPESLSEIKLQTNELEVKIKRVNKASRRVVNLDPGYLTPSALIMATAKNFAHRIPLQHGIYAHLELLFTKKDVRTLEWSYPDYRTEEYQSFFRQVRKIYLSQLAQMQ